MKEKLIGEITHYFGKIDVAIVKLHDTLKEGDVIHIKGKDTDFTQTVSSMQIEHKNVKTAKKGATIGMKVNNKIKEGDEIYLVQE